MLDFEWRVTRHEADVVSIFFGMNDAGCGIAGIDRFESGLEMWLRSLTSVGCPSCRPRIPSVMAARAATTHSRRTSRSFAILVTHTGAPLVDHFAHWAGLDERWGWYIDPWHVGERGHAELAGLMIATILG